ncbi:hypothetical protein BGZ60DRAFT_405105 [Tricladium varicosporioides]|nr:hypothetical protein BGZ60DRAFT_405105 [Hymenoscyphus varicosporioides]
MHVSEFMYVYPGDSDILENSRINTSSEVTIQWSTTTPSAAAAGIHKLPVQTIAPYQLYTGELYTGVESRALKSDELSPLSYKGSCDSPLPRLSCLATPDEMSKALPPSGRHTLKPILKKPKAGRVMNSLYDSIIDGTKFTELTNSTHPPHPNSFTKESSPLPCQPQTKLIKAPKHIPVRQLPVRKPVEVLTAFPETQVINEEFSSKLWKPVEVRQDGKFMKGLTPVSKNNERNEESHWTLLNSMKLEPINRELEEAERYFHGFDDLSELKEWWK